MMNEIYIWDIVDKLPEKIKTIIFSEELDNLIDNISTIAYLDDDQKVRLHKNLTNTLIGKIDTNMFRQSLYEINIPDSSINLIADYFNQKIFDKIKDDLAMAFQIYRDEQRKEEKPTNVTIKENKQEKMVGYIQELASSIKEKKPVILEQKNIKEEQKIPEIIPETKEKKIEEVVNIEVKSEPTKESILLKAMKQRETNSESKLTEYYKALKDNLDNKVEEKENVFQPPFRATKGRGALIESSIDTENINKINDIKEQKEDVVKNPVKYNSFNYIKKDKEENTPKSDDKFIDLGDF